MDLDWDIPGGPVFKNAHFQIRGHSSIPGWGRSACCMAMQKVIINYNLLLNHCPSVPWGGMWEEVQEQGTHVNLLLIHVDVWQKPTQHCDAVFHQLKKNFFFFN